MTHFTPLDGQTLAPDANLLRLPKPPKDFVPDAWQPDWSILTPSTGDKEHANRHNKPVRVSVWHDALTTIEQARTFRATPTMVLRFPIRAVFDVAESSGHAMRVVYDPLEPPECLLPGACGHAGIEGLERTANETKVQWKKRLADICDSMVLVAH